MKVKKYTFCKIAAFVLFLFLSAYSPVQAMESDSLDDQGKRVQKTLSQKEKKRRASAAYDKAMEKLVVKEYDGAFRRFVYAAFQDVFHVNDFKISEDSKNSKDYYSALLNGFGYHTTPPSEAVQRRHAAFGYVYTLWKSNGEGLNQECAIGKAMEKCVKELSVRLMNLSNAQLINFKCSPKTRSILLEDSKGWKLKKDYLN